MLRLHVPRLEPVIHQSPCKVILNIRTLPSSFHIDRRSGAHSHASMNMSFTFFSYLDRAHMQSMHQDVPRSLSSWFEITRHQSTSHEFTTAACPSSLRSITCRRDRSLACFRRRVLPRTTLEHPKRLDPPDHVELAPEPSPPPHSSNGASTSVLHSNSSSFTSTCANSTTRSVSSDFFFTLSSLQRLQVLHSASLQSAFGSFLCALVIAVSLRVTACTQAHFAVIPNNHPSLSRVMYTLFGTGACSSIIQLSLCSPCPSSPPLL